MERKWEQWYKCDMDNTELFEEDQECVYNFIS
jgi:hypothetical protein